VLSLSKHCFFFVGLEKRLEGQEQCFDKLSTSGFGIEV